MSDLLNNCQIVVRRYDAQQETLVESDVQYQPKDIDKMLAPYPYQHYQRFVYSVRACAACVCAITCEHCSLFSMFVIDVSFNSML